TSKARIIHQIQLIRGITPLLTTPFSHRQPAVDY
ncbi:glutamate decarboxylase, partial [Shigella dysenteriae]